MATSLAISVGDRTTAVERLLKVTRLIPFVGEPWTLLSQMYLHDGAYAMARESSRNALVRLLRMGFAWDYGHPWNGWIAIARLTHYRASRLMRGLTHLPLTPEGRIHLPSVPSQKGF